LHASMLPRIRCLVRTGMRQGRHFVYAIPEDGLCRPKHVVE
jgi:hypothetical protein